MYRTVFVGVYKYFWNLVILECEGKGKIKFCLMIIAILWLYLPFCALFFWASQLNYYVIFSLNIYSKSTKEILKETNNIYFKIQRTMIFFCFLFRNIGSYKEWCSQRFSEKNIKQIQNSSFSLNPLCADLTQKPTGPKSKESQPGREKMGRWEQ